MSYSFVYRPGYVYCVRRAGKPYYHLGHAPAGQLSDRFQTLAQLEKNPKDLRLVGWVEVRDYVTAEKKLKDAFHLYQRGDDWFEFRASRARDLKVLLEMYADLAQQLPVDNPLIEDEGVPEYDRSFGFFEFLHQISGRSYYPPIPTLASGEKPLINRSKWLYGIGGVAVALIGFLSTISPKSFTPRQAESVSTTPPSPTTEIAIPTSSPSPAAKAIVKTPVKTPVKVVEKPKVDGTQTVIWSPSSEGANLRSVPSESDEPDDETALDFIPNGTPVTLGEMSGAWQEVLLPNGQRGWVSNNLVKNAH
jgi:hypothetical protein